MKTYKHFILANGIKDSMDAYREYCEKYSHVYGQLSEKCKEQYLDANYKFRFVHVR